MTGRHGRSLVLAALMALGACAPGTGTADRTILSPTASGDPSAWSPDGAHIAVMNDLEPGGGRLYVMDADGSNLRVLAEDVDPTVAWSPDGTRLAYVDVSGVRPSGLGRVDGRLRSDRDRESSRRFVRGPHLR
jgi:Tol biopolymer transport system component